MTTIRVGLLYIHVHVKGKTVSRWLENALLNRKPHEWRVCKVSDPQKINYSWKSRGARAPVRCPIAGDVNAGTGLQIPADQSPQASPSVVRMLLVEGHSDIQLIGSE